MKSVELHERLRKAEENVAKIQKTIERHEAQAAKKLAVLEQNGWEANRYLYNDGQHDDAYWAVCEYENKLSDIKSAEKKLEEAERIRDNWKAKLDRQMELEKTIQTQIPEVFKRVRDELADRWTAWDIREREVMRQRKRELNDECGNDWRKFNKLWRDMYSYNREDSLNHTDEEFRKIEEKIADEWLLDLYNRVYAITGEIVDCSGITWGGKCLDGIVIGKAGKAVVNTIGAGGYNEHIILDSGRHGQRFHLRTLVNEMK